MRRKQKHKRWTPEDDGILMDCTRRGRSHLTAWRTAAVKLNRTAAACQKRYYLLMHATAPEGVAEVPAEAPEGKGRGCRGVNVKPREEVMVRFPVGTSLILGAGEVTFSSVE